MTLEANHPEPEVRSRRARRIPAEEARVEPYFAPARVLRRESLDAIAMLDAARAERDEATAALAKAQAEAARVVAAAESERDAILAVARAEADAMRQRGFEVGRADAATRLAEICIAITRADAHQREQYPQLVRDAAFRLARAILDVEFVVHPEIVREFVVAALERVGAEEVVVELSPSDHAFVGGDTTQLSASAGCGITRIRIAEDLADRHVRIVTTNGARWTIGLDQAFADLRTMVERTYSRGESR